MLTAAAVKIAGGGLGNDTCNILNEVGKLHMKSVRFLSSQPGVTSCVSFQDLYEEALNEGLTFDQYHKWLESRLEGTPESSVEKKAAATPAIARRNSQTKIASH